MWGRVPRAESFGGRSAAVALSHNRMADEHLKPPFPRVEQSTSSGLLRGLKAHDEQAWQRLLDLYASSVYSWCRSGGIPARDAAEILSDVLCAVFRGIGTFRRDQPGQTFRGWLRTVTKSKIADYWANRKGESQPVGGTPWVGVLGGIPAEDSDTSASAPPNPWVKLVHAALAKIQGEFEDRTWAAFRMTTFEDRSAKEVADALDTTPGAVRQAKYKVLRRLREELGDLE
jgi:RNA polymerase sigma-70 factor (ECF subfamily)